MGRAGGRAAWRVEGGGIQPYAAIRSALPRDRIVEVGGQSVHVEQRGRGEPVLLLHGFGCSSWSWRRLLPELGRRYRAIAPDLNGFGWTERPRDAASYTLEGQGAMVLGLLERLGLRRCHLVGHSYGGGLALWLAARQPSRFASLTLVAGVPPEYSDDQRQPWARYRSVNWLLVHFLVLSRVAVRRALRACYCDSELATPATVDEYRRRLLVEGVEDAYHGLLAPCGVPADSVELERIDVPALAIWGDSDRLIPLEQARTYLRRLPRLRSVVLERCGHAPMEERPEEVLSHLLPFLAAHRLPWRERVLGSLRGLARRAAALAS